MFTDHWNDETQNWLSSFFVIVSLCCHPSLLIFIALPFLSLSLQLLLSFVTSLLCHITLAHVLGTCNFSSFTTALFCLIFSPLSWYLGTLGLLENFAVDLDLKKCLHVCTHFTWKHTSCSLWENNFLLSLLNIWKLITGKLLALCPRHFKNISWKLLMLHLELLACLKKWEILMTKVTSKLVKMDSRNSNTACKLLVWELLIVNFWLVNFLLVTFFFGPGIWEILNACFKKFSLALAIHPTKWIILVLLLLAFLQFGSFCGLTNKFCFWNSYFCIETLQYLGNFTCLKEKSLLGNFLL